jgi:hypothetical protein
MPPDLVYVPAVHLNVGVTSEKENQTGLFSVVMMEEGSGGSTSTRATWERMDSPPIQMGGIKPSYC